MPKKARTGADFQSDIPAWQVLQERMLVVINDYAEENPIVPDAFLLTEIVPDEFHVLQHASAVLDEVRRQEFLRAGSVIREHGRGERWLVLRRWKTVRGSKRAELQALFAANPRLFKAYVLCEQLDRLWTYKTDPGVFNFLMGWFKALR
jgi:transposase